MPCTQCGKMTRMPHIRMVADGRVQTGGGYMPKYNAVCSHCLLKDVASSPQKKQEEQAAVVTEESYPF